jgi:hypothetical protein
MAQLVVPNVLHPPVVGIEQEPSSVPVDVPTRNSSVTGAFAFAWRTSMLVFPVRSRLA